MMSRSKNSLWSKGLSANSQNMKLNLFFFLFRQVSSHDYPVIESKIKGILKEKQPFERLVMTKENLLKMFEVSEIF